MGIAARMDQFTTQNSIPCLQTERCRNNVKKSEMACEAEKCCQKTGNSMKIPNEEHRTLLPPTGLRLGGILSMDSQVLRHYAAA